MTNFDPYDAFHSRAGLLFTDDEVDRLKQAVVAIAGLGGVGCIVVEMLARLGITNFRLADPERYELTNLNRQLFATLSTLDRKKVDVTRDRILDINPSATISLFDQGITQDTVRPFVSGATVVFSVADKLVPQILIHRVCEELRTPVIKGSRSKYPGHRWEVKSTIFDYRNPTVPFEDVNNLPSRALALSELNEAALDNVEATFKAGMIEKLNREVSNNNYLIFRPTDPGQHYDRFQNSPQNISRTVCAPIPNMAGILAVIEGLKVILGWPMAERIYNLICS